MVAHADVFGSGENSFDIDFVTIGNPRNPTDPERIPVSYGSVPYSYGISKYEVSEQMIDSANVLGGLDITHSMRGADKPATGVSWFEATTFVNWLNESTGNAPAYKFIEVPNGTRPVSTVTTFALWEPGDAGYDANNLFRNRLAKYVLPSLDEWHKAAYYDSATGSWFDYATLDVFPPTAVVSGTALDTAVFGHLTTTGPSDIMLAGGPGPSGTVAQGGNAREWVETEIDFMNDDPLARRFADGGFWESTTSTLSAGSPAGDLPQVSVMANGFRIARIPEADSLVLFCIATTISLAGYRKQLR